MSTWSPLSSGGDVALDEADHVIPVCPSCGAEDSRILNVRLSALFPGCRKRRRECDTCHARFTTVSRECLAPT